MRYRYLICKGEKQTWWIAINVEGEKVKSPFKVELKTESETIVIPGASESSWYENIFFRVKNFFFFLSLWG